MSSHSNSLFLSTIEKHHVCKKIEAFIHDNRLLSEYDSIVVALSGGADSVALACILAALSTKYHFNLHLCHIQHGLRDDALDLEIAKSVASIINLSFSVIRLELGQSLVKDANIEAQARSARYNAIFEFSASLGVKIVAVGHHGDENLETLLWRLTRQSGSEGICLRPSRVIEGFQIVRPLLLLEKSEIYNFLTELQIPWAEDPTNKSERFFRNRVREQVLDSVKNLAQKNENIFKSLIHLADDSEALTLLAQMYLRQASFSDGYCLIPRALFSKDQASAFIQCFRHASRRLLPAHLPSQEYLARVRCFFLDESSSSQQISDNKISITITKKLFCIFVNDFSLPVPFESIPVHFDEIFALPPKKWDLAPFGSLNIFPCAANLNGKNSPQFLAISIGENAKLSIEAAEHHPRFRADDHDVNTNDALRALGVPTFLRNSYPCLCLNGSLLWILGGPRSALAKRETDCSNLLIHWQCSFSI